MTTRKPLARSEDLVIEEVGDELLVYDGQNKRAHSLSAQAGQVWRACDGNTDIDGLALALELPHEVVVKAIEELQASELLESSGLQIVNGGSGNGLTRREMTLRSAKIGTAVAAAPMIYSLAVPSPAAAASPTNFACELFSTDSCGNSQGAGAIKGCCCCCQASNNLSSACKVGASTSGCGSLTCPDNTSGNCTGAPGSQPLTNGGCCGLSTCSGTNPCTAPANCGCAWGNPIGGRVGNTNVVAGCPSSTAGGAATGQNGTQTVTCCDSTGSSAPTSSTTGSQGTFKPCTQASITAGTCTACCCNGQVINQTSTYDCCNNASATCCSNPSTCVCPAGCPAATDACKAVPGCWP
jgi:hypothetical protein